MSNHSTNQERTDEYLKKFDREKILKYLLKEKNPTIFDVGANAGQSLVEFKKWWPDSRVHCFEPQHECWDSLDKYQSEYSQNDVVINKHAVGNTFNDKAIFYSHDITSGQSGFNKINNKSLDSIDLQKKNEIGEGNVSEYEKTINHERSVKIIRLDNYMIDNNINHIDLLKIDTQGHEPEVLEGFGEKLSEVDIVITELMFYDYYERSLSFSDIEKFLHPAGLHLYDINHVAKNPMNGRTDWVDVIYVNDRLRAGIK
jgi:FkbM family methyltransferase